MLSALNEGEPIQQSVVEKKLLSMMKIRLEIANHTKIQIIFEGISLWRENIPPLPFTEYYQWQQSAHEMKSWTQILRK